MPHLDKKRTIKEAVRRTAGFVEALMQKTGASEEICREALAQANGDILQAEALIRSGEVSGNGAADVRLFTDDLRYRTIEIDMDHQSNAVVLAMMDVSGSMGTTKKYLARSFFFWMVEFLRQIYKNVQIRFIAHTTEAQLVDEHEFFHKGESGGTYCHSALDLAIRLVETEYNTARWNVYPFLFSDGEDFEPMKSVASARRLMELGVNILGYGEIQTNPYISSQLMDAFDRELHLVKRYSGEGGGFTVHLGSEPSVPFIGAVLQEKSHVYPALREFLRKERAFET